MPPRFAYWTIIAGGLPTAFRSADRDEILPTFQRLREKHPDALLKWFARGKLWESPEEARADLERHRRSRDERGGRTSSGPRDRRAEGHGPNRRAESSGSDRRAEGGGRGDSAHKKRDRDWRPGGEHRDPRKKFADAKKARHAARRQQRFERKQGGFKPRDGHSGFKPRDAQGGFKPRDGAARGRSDTPRAPGTEHRRSSGTEHRPPKGGDRNSHARRPKPAHTGTPNSSTGRPDWKPPSGDRRPFERTAFHRKDPRPRETKPGDDDPSSSSPRGGAASKADRFNRRPRDRFRRS